MLTSNEIDLKIANRRYEVISKIVRKTIKGVKAERLTLSDLLDEVLLDKYLGIPLFLVIVWVIFQLVFMATAPLSDLLDLIFSNLREAIISSYPNNPLASMVANGIVGGIGTVMMFIPSIFFLFLCLSILEDSGYMARAAFIMDKLMYKIGLHGKSFICLILGFGCNVPAVMAARSIEDRGSRIITVLVNPFISCSARLPVYMLLSLIFFREKAATVIVCLYGLGILVTVLTSIFLRKIVFKDIPSMFMLEFPRYKVPNPRDVMLLTWDRLLHFLKKAGTTILLGVILMWILSSYPLNAPLEETAIAAIGKFLEPIFAPLGWNWKIAVSLLFGFMAKELIVGAFGLLYGREKATMMIAIRESISPESALALLVFSAIYMPCLATISAMKQELNSTKWTFAIIVYSLLLAYILAYATYIIGGVIL